MERDLELEDATSHQKMAETNQDLFSYMAFSVFVETGTIKTNVSLGFTLGQVSDLLIRKKKMKQSLQRWKKTRQDGMPCTNCKAGVVFPLLPMVIYNVCPLGYSCKSSLAKYLKNKIYSANVSGFLLFQVHREIVLSVPIVARQAMGQFLLMNCASKYPSYTGTVTCPLNA